MSGDRCAMRDLTAAIRSRSVRSTDCMYKHQRSLFFLSPLSDTFFVQIKMFMGKQTRKTRSGGSLRPWAILMCGNAISFADKTSEIRIEKLIINFISHVELVAL